MRVGRDGGDGRDRCAIGARLARDWRAIGTAWPAQRLRGQQGDEGNSRTRPKRPRGGDAVSRVSAAAAFA